MRDLLKPVGPREKETGSIWQKLSWFVVLAAASVVVVSSVAYLLRALLFIG